MIKFFITICLLLISAVLCAAQASSTQTRSSTPTVEKMWEEFSLTGGQFVISMPGKPTSHSIPLDSKAGSLIVHLLVLDTPLESYGVTYVEFPDRLDEQSKSKVILDGTRDKELVKIGGRLVKESDVSIDSYPGRELTIEVADGFWVDRIYLVGKRLYAVSAFTSKAAAGAVEITDSQQALIRRYLESFKLKS